MDNQKINRITMSVCMPLTVVLLIAMIITCHIYCIYGLGLVTLVMLGTAIFFRIDHNALLRDVEKSGKCCNKGRNMPS